MRAKKTLPDRCGRTCGWAVLLAIAIAGCNKEQVEQALNQGKDQATKIVEQSVETVKQEANLVGSMELTTNPPIAAKACYAKLIIIGDGRPGVFRLASYKSSELERFPSMMLQAQTDAKSLSELVGKTVNADLFAQVQADGPVWHSLEDSPVSVTISAVDDKSLTCQCSGQVVNSDTGKAAAVSGKFVAMLE